ncbi:TetR/AcrR family transcriptional regulator [Bacillus altitudinis]|uniref:TetR/AcrR family transcriptional regulator n=1 Tax=Bacillus altitudinis TaxID=293387 RepID=UPI00030BAC7D|nr:TetR/AcrR family transcriptional regulator [Bacillus altitudinis]QKL21720.1 TetR/AcrR family transcriptional regulator [Bacillus altitudinis]QKL25453.1 TetR/AcrR family transcriptional regulator [Bacillus altitudinis]QXY95835.1 TetR/AcrR family transcriptional regulator [Bacillus altitudinis]
MPAATTDKQEQIMKASLDLFIERGFDGTTMPMISKRANVGAGTIYRYFDSKEALVNILYQRSLTAFIDKVNTNSPDPKASIRAYFKHVFYCLVLFTKENPSGLYFLEIDKRSHYLDEKSKEKMQQLLNELFHIFEEGKKDGIHPNLSGRTILSIVFGAFVQLHKQILAEEIEPSIEFLEDIEQCLWRAISVAS